MVNQMGACVVKQSDPSSYYPDGSFPSDYVYVPCSGDESTSCCIMSEGDQCLSNGTCIIFLEHHGLSGIFRLTSFKDCATIPVESTCFGAGVATRIGAARIVSNIARTQVPQHKPRSLAS